MQVSVIIPMYNAEKFIVKAMESVLNQTFIDFEFIIVNDASKDESVRLVEEYAKKDSRIKLLHNTAEDAEHGAFAARNKGIDAAMGKYIYFMDADDFIDPKLLEDNLKLMEENDGDIVMFGYLKEVTKNGKTNCYSHHHILEGCYDRAGLKENIDDFWSGISLTVWNCLFKRETMGNMRFSKMKGGSDDTVFLLEYLEHSERIILNRREYYHYIINANSVSNRWNPAVIDSRYACAEAMKNFFKSLEISEEECLSTMSRRMVGFYSAVIYSMSFSSCPYSSSEKMECLKEVREKLEVDRYACFIDYRQLPFVERVKTFFICHKKESVLVTFGPLFLKTVRGM